MFREGELNLRLDVQAGRIRSVAIASTRVTLPPQLTHGRPADDVARTMPLLFSICARAQGAAAAGALDAARGRDTDHEELDRRNGEVRHEAAVELLTRLLMDWPRVLGGAPDIAALARARQTGVQRGLDICRAIARDQVYALEPARWLAEPTLEALDRWATARATLPAHLLSQLQCEAAGLGCSDIGTMPEVSAGAICTMLPPLDAPEFSRTPEWMGQPVETGALARRARHPLVAAFVQREGNCIAARFVAQLVDLAMLLSTNEAPVVRQHASAPGIGVGIAETARGLLLHQAQVAADGRVQRYRLVAPTEWNFHPDGAMTRGLIGRRVKDTAAARRDATLLAQALDPCAAFAVEVANA